MFETDWGTVQSPTSTCSYTVQKSSRFLLSSIRPIQTDLCPNGPGLDAHCLRPYQCIAGLLTCWRCWCSTVTCFPRFRCLRFAHVGKAFDEYSSLLLSPFSIPTFHLSVPSFCRHLAFVCPFLSSFSIVATSHLIVSIYSGSWPESSRVSD